MKCARRVVPALLLMLVTPVSAQSPTSQPGFVAGRGYGWVWGQDDEIGAFNMMTDASRTAALRLARTGKVYDLGVPYSRNSYKWPGHNPGEIVTFRSPEGVKRGTPQMSNARGNAWHSCALFISDNVGTQIDGLGHFTTGDDNHWYNGFRESDWGGDFGLRKCDAATIPPVIARGVLLDIAGMKGVDALPAGYAIGVKDLQAALTREKIQLAPGDIVLIRTGTLRYWGRDGADHAKLAAHDSAGLSLEGARWLVEQHGAIMLGSDTSGLEAATPGAPLSVHEYLLIEQGVHIGELHYLEDLARDHVYEFCYIASTNKILGAATGFTLRPLALR